MLLLLSGKSSSPASTLLSPPFPDTLTITAPLYILPSVKPYKIRRTSSSTIYNTTPLPAWSRTMPTRPSLPLRTTSRSSCSRPTPPRVPAFQEFQIRSVRRSGRSTGPSQWHTLILPPRSSTSVDRTHTTILSHHHRPTNPPSANGPSGQSTTRPSSWPKRWAHTIPPSSSISRQTNTLPFMPYMRTAHRRKWRCLILCQIRLVHRRTPLPSPSAVATQVRATRRLRKCKSSKLLPYHSPTSRFKRP
jgi:hypothetical protein